MAGLTLSAAVSAGIGLTASAGVSSGFAQWKMSFGVCPIVFMGGIALSMPGGQMPIISVTDAGSFSNGPLGQLNASIGVGFSASIGGVTVGANASLGAGVSLQAGAALGDPGLDGYFATYEPMPGGTLEDFEYGKYPFANQSVAANAVIQEPLQISMLMICPVKGTQTWGQHLSVITALKSAMDQHAAMGGSYTVATPKFIYTNCLLRRFSDVTVGDSLQPQSRWQLDFETPLISLQQAQQAQNGLLSKMSSGTQLPGSAGSVTDALTSALGALPAGLSPAAVLPMLSSGVSSFAASTLISTVLPSGITMAGALTSLSGVIPSVLNANSALQVLSGVVPTGISPAQIPGLLATLAPAGITTSDAMNLLAGGLPGGVSPASVMQTLTSVLPTGVSLSGGLSLLSQVNLPSLGVSLSGGIATLGQPLTTAAPPTVPAALVLPAAGVPTVSAGAFVGVTLPFVGPVGVGASVTL